MNGWLITQKPSFLNELLSLPPKEISQVQKKLVILVKDPSADGHVKKKLKGWENVYRLRSGNYRILYNYEKPYISLLGLRRRNDATYMGGVEAEQLGGLARDGSKSQENQFGWQVENDDQQTTASTPLPEPITHELLVQLQVPEAYHERLIRLDDRDDLLACPGVPDEILLRIDEVMFERPLGEVLDQPDLVANSVDDLFRFKKGDLAGFLLKLSPTQEELVTLNIEGPAPTLVKGGPGSGKSTVALYRTAEILRRLRSEGVTEPRLLFTTYTNALINVSRGLLKTLLGEDAGLVEVATADSKVRVIIERTSASFHPAEQEALLQAVQRARDAAADGTNALERMRSRQVIEHLTDDYLVDEICSVIQAREIGDLDSYLPTIGTDGKSRSTRCNVVRSGALRRRLREDSTSVACRHGLSCA